MRNNDVLPAVLNAAVGYLLLPQVRLGQVLARPQVDILPDSSRPQMFVHLWRRDPAEVALN